jgi:hypothetical protein
LKHLGGRTLTGLAEQLPRHCLEQVAARERCARKFHRCLVVARRVIGKSLPRGFEIDAFEGLARKTRSGFAVPGKVV